MSNGATPGVWGGPLSSVRRARTPPRRCDQCLHRATLLGDKSCSVDAKGASKTKKLVGSAAVLYTPWGWIKPATERRGTASTHNEHSMPKGERSPSEVLRLTLMPTPSSVRRITVHAPPQVRLLLLPASAAPSQSGPRSTRSPMCAESTASTPRASRRMHRSISHRCAGPAFGHPKPPLSRTVCRLQDVTGGDLSGLAGQEFDLLIVGAGLSGAVLAERCSKELGMTSLIIDCRNHIGGNCYDYIDEHGEPRHARRHARRRSPMARGTQRASAALVPPRRLLHKRFVGLQPGAPDVELQPGDAC